MAGDSEAPSLGVVLRALPEVARQQGCAYWSARAAMGGERSMVRWQRAQPPLGHADGVHLSAAGYERLADHFVADLLAAYARAKPEAQKGVARGEKP